MLVDMDYDLLEDAVSQRKMVPVTRDEGPARVDKGKGIMTNAKMQREPFLEKIVGPMGMESGVKLPPHAGADPADESSSDESIFLGA
ncbi:unnamed protein product [Arabis nemorensis]|uniref:Uncharacterized protein n=1 Tax=Arabis nemorensis TaxID=586526 RepID=A0A565BJX8_9BRAS|nr:unnamed protein product [Arabis nemorensis]